MLITPHCLLSCLAVVVSSSLFVSYLLLGLHVFVCSGNHHGDADATVSAVSGRGCLCRW